MDYSDFLQHAYQFADAMCPDPELLTEPDAIDGLMAYCTREATKIGEPLGNCDPDLLAEYGGQDAYETLVRRRLVELRDEVTS